MINLFISFNISFFFERISTIVVLPSPESTNVSTSFLYVSNPSPFFISISSTISLSVLSGSVGVLFMVRLLIQKVMRYAV